MEEAKAEVEKKLSMLLKLIQNKNKIPESTKKELLGVVNDLQDQFQLLYSVIHDLGNGGRKGKSVIVSSSRSSSDLDYYSSEEIEIGAGNVVGETLSSNYPVMIEELKRQVRNLTQETDYLRDQNMELAGNVEGKRNEDRAGNFKGLMTKDEVAFLCNQKNELELQLEKRTYELKRLEEETEERVKAEMKSKATEIDLLKEENQKLLTKIEELHSRKEESIDETTKKLVKETDKLSEDQKVMKRWSFGSKLNTGLLERKMEELAEDFRMKLEDQIRLLYRRIHVAEQIHLESKSDYIKTTQTQENRGDSTVSQTQFKKIKDMVDQGLAGPEMAIKKLEEGQELSTRVTRLAKEVDSARKCVQEKKSEMKHEVETLEAKLECREAQESLLKEKLSKLEANLGEEGTGKLSLAKAMRRIKKLEINVKERDVELLSLGEEKREAIRQLCVLVDYQRCRYDDLKTSIFKVALQA